MRYSSKGGSATAAFLKGKQHSKKGISIGCRHRLDLATAAPINKNPLPNLSSLPNEILVGLISSGLNICSAKYESISPGQSLFFGRGAYSIGA
jgi:hypothetical protein